MRARARSAGAGVRAAGRGGDAEAGEDGHVPQGGGDGIGGEGEEEQAGADSDGFPLLLQAADGAESGAGGAAGEKHHVGRLPGVFANGVWGESIPVPQGAGDIERGVSTAIKHDWCDSNPVARVEVPEVVEKPIEPLTIEEVERLEEAAQLPEHEDMQLSLHLMLYCGIRPTEVSRIDPERDIDWQNQRVVVRPTTSKTGGGRVVPLRCGNIDALRHDIPRRWVQRWRALRKAAGWSKETAHP